VTSAGMSDEAVNVVQRQVGRGLGPVGQGRAPAGARLKLRRHGGRPARGATCCIV
jgi:hypothetical protein